MAKITAAPASDGAFGPHPAGVDQPGADRSELYLRRFGISECGQPAGLPVMETTLTPFRPERRLEGDSAFQMAGEPREFPSAGAARKEESGWTALSCLLPGSGGRSCPGATTLGSQDKKGQAPEPHKDAPDKDNIQPISNGGA